MSLNIGIVGLPNVGKSTLFNILTNSNVESQNYPFTTIDPNKAIVQINDKRIDNLVTLMKSKKVVYPTINYVDIAGIIKNASEGEGLGNMFLSHIRSVDIIVHLVRCFDNKNIIHVENRIDPQNDIEIINLELILSDLSIVNKAINKRDKKKMNSKELEALKEVSSLLSKNKIELISEELLSIIPVSLICTKPVIYIFNVDHNQFQKEQDTIKTKFHKYDPLYIDIKFEEEILKLDKEDQDIFLNEINNINHTSQLLERSIKISNLIMFFTSGEQETRGWLIEQNKSALDAANMIHSDIADGFIKAETISYDDLIKDKSIKNAKVNGNVKFQGREYLIQDGDVIYIHFKN